MEAERFPARRLIRIACLALAGLAGLDCALAPLERSMRAGMDAGLFRNTEGQAIADACLAMLRSDAELRRSAVVLTGSSVSFGSNVPADEALPAALARALAEQGAEAPVFNCAQPGGRPETPIPLAAASGALPPGLLMVEILVPSYARRDAVSAPAWGPEEIVMLTDATASARSTLVEGGWWPTAAQRIEARAAAFVRSHWRAYRVRGRLWIDDSLLPSQVVWTVRREAAAAGWLPKRFQGQTTNIDRLPWRKAYVGGQKPSPSQRFRVPEVAVMERAYESLRVTQRLADEAGVPVLFFEVPLNLDFQRAFDLMDEPALARLASLRELLFERMRRDGMHLVEAPELPDDGYLDKAHLTALGAEQLGRHLAAIVSGIPRGDP